MTSDVLRPGHGPGGHETRDVNARRLLQLGLALATVIGLVLVVGVLFFDYLERSTARGAPQSPLLTTSDRPPSPRLQVDPQLDLLQKRAQEDAVLNSYGWVDRATGTVRMPIERAIELTAQRGLPVRKGIESSPVREKDVP
jgi:hypothetical protein